MDEILLRIYPFLEDWVEEYSEEDWDIKVRFNSVVEADCLKEDKRCTVNNLLQMLRQTLWIET